MRKAYIEKQKREHNRKVLAVLPIHYPKEILTALDILAVELWGPPGPPRGDAAGRLQVYICSLVRNATAFLAGDDVGMVDGVLYPHTCDSIQGMSTLLEDFGGWEKPVFRFFHPRGESRKSLRTFLVAELKSLAAQLSDFVGREMDMDALRRAIAMHRRIDEARAGLLGRRSHLEMSDSELYRVLRRGEFLWPEDHLQELREAEGAFRPEVVQKGIPIMISGYVPEPMAIFQVLEEAGAFVAADDYAGVGRRLVPSILEVGEDPFATLAEMSYAAPPCPTQTSTQGRRMEYLSRLFDAHGAVGVIVHELKFCEPELFDYPAIKKTFSEKGAPVLLLEGELELELSGQVVTRIEAFIELLDSGEHGGAS